MLHFFVLIFLVLFICIDDEMETGNLITLGKLVVENKLFVVVNKGEKNVMQNQYLNSGC